MAWTSDDIAALERALASGISEVQFADGRRVRYRSLAEIRETIRIATAATTTAAASRTTVIGF